MEDGTRLRKCLTALLDGFLSIREHDPTYDLINPHEAVMLEIIHNKPNPTMSDLAKSSGVPANTMTGIVDRLVRQGLVQRETSEKDRRLVLVTLTEYGLEILEKSLDLLDKYSQRLLLPLVKKEQKILIELLEKVTKNI